MLKHDLQITLQSASAAIPEHGDGFLPTLSPTEVNHVLCPFITMDRVFCLGNVTGRGTALPSWDRLTVCPSSVQAGFSLEACNLKISLLEGFRTLSCAAHDAGDHLN